MSTLHKTGDNVTTVHDAKIEMAGRYVAALGAQWYDLTREDRREATRTIGELIVSLHVLGVRVEGVTA
jgi:hypothetical protein